MIEFVKPTEELLFAIADNMRDADRIEVMASHGHSPVEALLMGWSLSAFSTVAVYDGIPVVAFGLVITSVLTGAGTPWMLASKDVKKCRSELLKKTPSVIDSMLVICPKLSNHVHADNRQSVRWLKWLGFTIDDPEPIGINGELFHRFHNTRY